MASLTVSQNNLSSTMGAIEKKWRSVLPGLPLTYLLGAPLAWYAMNQWLQDFAYRIELTPGIFVSAGLVLTLIAVVTIGFQTVKAAGVAPVESLKNE